MAAYIQYFGSAVGDDPGDGCVAAQLSGGVGVESGTYPGGDGPAWGGAG